MNKEDEYRKTAEKLVQPSSIVTRLEGGPTGETRIVVRNDSDGR